ncbi:conserved hypothetical protein [Beutenbergia cavernae DSM 12333]|uniref:Uncharacterized protein n=1 Tax=Beutenbergia cavernae (strain ATCC BAA-8 / DSM 12333 / CCUG 43141 / JCM 11478 / NBRC 16432 / NCIMB 13614 / HKI 0122) TaxID=471853 RepID=C5C4M7_BEUC1|nr:hypothetical protein [Beutenbergia cavernae]ACQ82151.1 conserved hypothetical protein [Beutenbergia cavernae DSM 12333]
MSGDGADEIELISDGDGVAVIGSTTAVERFLATEGLPSRDLRLARLGSALSAGAGAAQAGPEIAANSGRWVKLTKESARALKQFEPMKGSTEGVSRAVLTKNGKIKSILEFARTPGSLLTNPAMLAGAAGLMAQLAMQQTMDEITDYLAVIDAKVDDVLRAQKDAVLADMIGVDLVIDESMVVREHVGGVSEVTWSKVQGASATIARTQAYALRQLDALAEKVERQTKMSDLAKASKEVEGTAQEWLAVLARCFQLQDAIAVLELDRVLGAAPDEVDRHRKGLLAARRNRLELISRCTERLIERMGIAAGSANAKVLLHPSASRDVVRSSNNVTVAAVDLRDALGLEGGPLTLEARRWVDAAVDARDRVLESGAEGIDATRRIGNETIDRTRSAAGKVSRDLAERIPRRRRDRDQGGEDADV